jgi:hypothetical protein
LPNEVALCLSYQAVAISGESQARRRGRIFFGPLCNTANTLSATGECRPSAALVTALCGAATLLATPAATAAGDLVHWAVYSPTTDLTETIDDAFQDVDNGWVDNSFDTQRRRGRDATARTTWT